MRGWITQITQMTHNVRSFHLHIPNRPEYKAGQFIVLNVEAKGKKRKRAYSIASAPHWENVEILVKLQKKGKVTPTLFEKKVGDSIEVQLPYGTFYLEEKIPKKMVFLAGGVGISPLLSIIRHLEWTGNKSEKTLIYANRTPKDIICKEELDYLQKKGEVKVIYTIDHPKGTNWKGEKGYITEKLIEKNCDTKKSTFYICGPPQMASHMVQNLEHLKVNHKKIEHEQW